MKEFVDGDPETRVSEERLDRPAGFGAGWDVGERRDVSELHGPDREGRDVAPNKASPNDVANDLFRVGRAVEDTFRMAKETGQALCAALILAHGTLVADLPCSPLLENHSSQQTTSEVADEWRHVKEREVEESADERDRFRRDTSTSLIVDTPQEVSQALGADTQPASRRINEDGSVAEVPDPGEN